MRPAQAEEKVRHKVLGLVPPVIRPLRPADLPVVDELEQRLFGDPWPQSFFLDALAAPEAVCLVAERHGAIAGYLIATLDAQRERGAGRLAAANDVAGDACPPAASRRRSPRRARRPRAARQQQQAAPRSYGRAHQRGCWRSGGADVPCKAPFGIGARNPYRGERIGLSDGDLVLLTELEERDERDDLVDRTEAPAPVAAAAVLSDFDATPGVAIVATWATSATSATWATVATCATCAPCASEAC